MDREALQLKIKLLHSIGEAIRSCREVLEAERSDDPPERVECLEETLEKLSAIYDECIDCCLETVYGK